MQGRDKEIKEEGENDTKITKDSEHSNMVEDYVECIVEDVVLDEDEGLKTLEDFVKESRMIHLKNDVLLDALEQTEENERKLIKRIKILKTKLRWVKMM